MKVHSLLGQKEIPWHGESFVTDEYDDVEVPDELAGRPPSGDPEDDNYDPGEGLLAQVDAWGSAKGRRKQKSEGFAHDEVVGADTENGEG